MPNPPVASIDVVVNAGGQRFPFPVVSVLGEKAATTALAALAARLDDIQAQQAAILAALAKLPAEPVVFHAVRDAAELEAILKAYQAGKDGAG